MKRLCFVLIAFAFFSCGTNPREGTGAPETAAPQTFQDSLNGGLLNLNQLIFGRVCGFCRKDCATMYIYKVKGNANKLWLHKSDRFNSDSIKADIDVNTKPMQQLAGNVFSNLPPMLFHTPDSTQRFGCPDCADQCGFYVEIGQENRKKKFHIDTNIEALPDELKSFTSLLKMTLQKMDSVRLK